MQNCQAALERVDERRREQQERSGAATAEAVARTGGVENRVSGGISGSRVGCADGSELPDKTDFRDAGHDDMADYIETKNNDTAIEEEMHGDLQTSDNDHYNNRPQTTHNNQQNHHRRKATKNPTSHKTQQI